MDAIERDNPALKGVLPKDYARPALDKQRLGELIDLIGDHRRSGDAAEPREGHRSGRVYEYFLGEFASAEGKKGGQFYTPRSRRALLVEMLEPYKGRVYDPCCGSGGMFVQSREVRRGARRPASATSPSTGRSRTTTTWRLAKMNLAIRGIDAQTSARARRHASTDDLHPDLKADYVLANPPFNDQRLGRRPAARGRALEVRHAAGRQRQLRLGAALPPPPRARRASPGFVLANGSMSSNQSGEGEIRKAIVEADLWTAWWRCRGSSSTRRRSRSACGSWRATRTDGAVPRPTRRDAVHRRPQARARWSTARTAS